MTHRPLLLVPGLALIVGATATAADAPPGVIGTGTSVVELGPGKIQGGGRSVYIQGLIDLDYVNQGNYTDGNNDRGDHRSEGWYRAELGTRISVDERVEVQVTVAGQGIMGSNLPTSDATAFGGPTNGPENGQTGNAVLDDAFVKLKDFLNYRELAVMAGRMPVSWNLRKDHAAFLFDSRANYGTVTSWDGVKASYNLDTLNFTPYVFRRPDDSDLYGITVDWEPAKSGDDRLFFTASANLERDVVLGGGLLGDKLETYYVGADADLASFELFAEFAMQHGSQSGGVDFKGWAVSGGVDWHPVNQLVLGLQGDYFTGDDNPTDDKNSAFVAPWEGVSDTLIVENEKYGELSRLLVGNLQAYKAKVEVALDDKKRVRIKSVYGYYKTAETVPGAASKQFGQEVDLSLAWDYTHNATITLQSALFKPDDAYRAVAPVTLANAGNDLIYFFGANLLVKK
jgi:hypothetical protein